MPPVVIQYFFFHSDSESDPSDVVGSGDSGSEPALERYGGHSAVLVVGYCPNESQSVSVCISLSL